jgi:hypothetical protein
MIEGSAGAFIMRFAILPIALLSLPLCAQWDLRLELPRTSGQSLPQTLITGTGDLISGNLDTGKGFIASVNWQLLQMGPLGKLECGLEYSKMNADGGMTNGSVSQGTTLNQQGPGLSLNAQVWIPFTGIAGEIGLVQRFQHCVYDTNGASTSKDLSRTWLRVGGRWRLPMVGIHPYLVASYQQPLRKDHPLNLNSAADLATYFTAQGNGLEFDRMWTFGAGVAF